jgi:hypothetical protein
MLIISKESAILKIRAPTRQRNQGLNQGLLTDRENLVLFTIKKAGLFVHTKACLSLITFYGNFLF